MKPRRLAIVHSATARTTIAAALAALVATLAPAAAQAARLQVHRAHGSVVVQLVGAPSRPVAFSLDGRSLVRLNARPYRLVIGRSPARGGTQGPRARLVARDAKTGRRLAGVMLPLSRPTVVITSAPPSRTTATDARFTFAVRNATRVSCRLDGAAWAACTSPVDYDGLAVGTHEFTVVASRWNRSATAGYGWTIETPVTPPPPPPPPAPLPPPPPPPPPPPSGIAPPNPPAGYTVPAGALQVSTSAGLISALSASTARDIVLADGVYDANSPFWNTAGHRIYAAHLGGAVLMAGLVFGQNYGQGDGLVRGVAFDVVDPAKTLQSSIIHVWGRASGTRVLDVTLDGHMAIGAGLLVRQPEGFVVSRVISRNFIDWGVNVDANDQNLSLSTPVLIEDVDSANVTHPVPRSSNGTSEACVWIGNTATVRRIRTRNCAWEGLWVGTATHDALFEDLDLDDSLVGIYVEHFSYRSTFQRVHYGRNTERGVMCEWADPVWGGRTACVDNVFQDSVFESWRIGVVLDEGTTRTTVRRSTFIGQCWAAIGNYRGNGNLGDTGGNDYSLLDGGAVPVRTDHYYGATCS